MIRLFLHICKTFHKIKHLDDHTVYSLIQGSSPSMPFSCPSCHAPSPAFRHNGSYERHLVCYSGGSVCDRMVTVRSFLCSSCGHSHALLPSLIIPYSPYSPSFLISLLYARITRRFPSVASLCAHFDISESTYYRIRRRFILDSKAFLDALSSLLDACSLTETLSPIKLSASLDPALFHNALSLFFLSTGHSFLQPCIKLRPKIPSTGPPPGYHQIP